MGLFDKLFLKKTIARSDLNKDLQHLHTSLNLACRKDLPTKVDDFKDIHIKVLRQLDKHPVNESFTGIITKELDIPNFIPILKQLGLIEMASCLTALGLLKNNALKDILKQNNLKVSGTKQDLVDRIWTNISEDNIRHSSTYTDFYILTANGYNLISDFTKQSENINLAFFTDCIDLILNRNFNDAYQRICKRNTEISAPPGLGVDWDKSYYTELSKKEELIYQKIFNSDPDTLVVSAAIFSMMSGVTQSETIKYFNKLFPEHDSSKIGYTISIANNIKDIHSYIECNIDKYIFLASLDSKTCPICGKLDGKAFFTKDAKIGLNYPPMHTDCRCTTIAYATKKQLANIQRHSCNPITHKSELVSGDIVYSKWIKQFQNSE